MLRCSVLLIHGGLASTDTVKVPDPEDFVNVLAGTVGGEKAGMHHSTGNTLPLVAMPWGFNHWAPQTADPAARKTSWWFDANADTFYGLRCTHQPSPWMGDYGWFLLVLHTGYAGNSKMGFTSYHAEGALRPHLIDLTLGPFGHRLQLTPTNHGGLLRVTFPESALPQHRRLCVMVPKGDLKDKDEKRSTAKQIPSGSCLESGGGINVESRRFADGTPDSFAFFGRLESPGLRVETAPIADCFEKDQQWDPLNMPGQERSALDSASQCQMRCKSTASCAHFTFYDDGGCHLQDARAKKKRQGGVQSGPPKCAESTQRECCFISQTQQVVEVKIGTSFISAAQALRALDAEVSGRSFDFLAAGARSIWRAELRKVEVLEAGPPTAATFRRLEIFYTSLYRALLFPRRLEEETPAGLQHWSPYSGQVVSGVGVSDNGFWDTFRTVYPFLSIAYPKTLSIILTGWLNAFKAGGWLPKWASPGYRDMMVGTFADVVLADAIIKNISGFDRELAWKALYKDSYEAFTVDSSRGKTGLKHYQEKGFVPIDVGVSEACSRTLDFAFADAACAAAAQRLGKRREAQELKARSQQALRELYEPQSGLMGHRKKNQDFVQEAPETWGDCYTEGSAWHHSFPPFDLDTLMELHGGRDKLTQKLDELFTVPSNFKTGSYKNEIHEMREMRMLGMGQYAHNNQPAHHLPYLFAMLGDHNTTAKLVRQILTRAYSPEGYAGDEDNGEMGSWYVLSALGLYDPTPGVTENYVLGAVPLFKRVRLHELDITIEAPSAVEASPVVKEVLWHSRLLPGTIAYSELSSGGVLRFVSPGDANLGTIVSNVRGAIHHAARQVRVSAERAVASPKLRAPSVVGEVVMEEALDKAVTPPPERDEEDGPVSKLPALLASLGLVATIYQKETSLHYFFVVSVADISTTNMWLFDVDGKIQKYDNPEDILQAFFPVRYQIYERRKAYLVDKMERELAVLSNKLRFVELVVGDRLDVEKKRMADLCGKMRKLGLEHMCQIKGEGSVKVGTEVHRAVDATTKFFRPCTQFGVEAATACGSYAAVASCGDASSASALPDSELSLHSLPGWCFWVPCVSSKPDGALLLAPACLMDVAPELVEQEASGSICPLLQDTDSRESWLDQGMENQRCWHGARGSNSPEPEVARTRDRVFCKARVSVTHVDVKTGKFQVRMLCQWAFRTASLKSDTEISYRGVPGIRVPGLQTEVQESRVWKDLNDTESSSKNRTIFWRGSSIFWMTGFKKYPVSDFPFDRHVICLQQIDFVWRVHRDDDTFYDSMKVAWLDVETSSVLAEWSPLPATVQSCDDPDKPVTTGDKLAPPDSKGANLPFATKFQIRLRIERKHGFYVRQILVISTLITLSSCSPLAMPPTEDHMGDRLSVYGGGLLTLVAFKYGIMDHLPSVPYSTFTDDFLMGQIITVAFCILECLVVYRYTLAKTWIDEVENYLLVVLAVGWGGLLSYTWLFKPTRRTNWMNVYEQQMDDFELAQADLQVFPSKSSRSLFDRVDCASPINIRDNEISGWPQHEQSFCSGAHPLGWHSGGKGYVHASGPLAGLRAREVDKIVPWRGHSHINTLELGAIGILERQLSLSCPGSCFTVLVDSSVAKSSSAKGRSTSRALQPSLRRAMAHQIGFDLYPAFAFAPTRLNVADDPTRSAPLRPPCREALHRTLPLAALHNLGGLRLRRPLASWARLFLVLAATQLGLTSGLLRLLSGRAPLLGDGPRPSQFDFACSSKLTESSGRDLNQLIEIPLDSIEQIAEALVAYGQYLFRPWDLAFAWLTEEPSIHHRAMPKSILLAVMSVALLWGWATEAAIFGLTWAGLLRIGETLNAVRSDLVLPDDAAPGTFYALLQIRAPKTRGRSARHQAARIDPSDIVKLLAAVFGPLPPGAKLWPFSDGVLRRRLRAILQRLSLSDDAGPAFDLASLRPGGATRLLQETENAELVRRRGRWLSGRVMEIYLQEVTAITYVPRLPGEARAVIESLALNFAWILEKALFFEESSIPRKAWYYLFSGRSTALAR
ncbi:unnamed protein product [Symbiodinium sp. KB8]|nr:unnamed protein product [Symbiodinium sp. KB8]